MECGHRCAIPTCLQVPVELAHIVPWSKCKKHTFDNLIALCPTCHTRYDKGDIDRKSMLIYKHALLMKSSRYGDLEQRLLRKFSRDGVDEAWLLADLDILLQFLLEDRLLEDSGQTRNAGGVVQKLYRLTTEGKKYLATWPAL